MAATFTANRESRPIDTYRPGSAMGRYVLDKRLGAGAMGVVWSAHDPKLDREVAIKLVHPELARSEHAATRLLREARAMAKLSHRSVITVHDAGDVDGQLFLAMELVRGTTLGHLLRTRDPAAIADWPRWLGMMLDAGRGLAEAHRNGVLHRDFKPDNVLVDGAGRVCVGDFGLAMLGDRADPSHEPAPATAITLDGTSGGVDLTSTGAVLGTPLYMSPQQLNAEVIDARADQFAFCVATFEALYGARPFSTQAQGLAAIPALVDEIKQGIPAPPPDSPVPQSIHDVLARGLAVSPEDRWADMDALITALEHAGKRRGATVIKPMRSRWIPVAIIGALACAAIAVIAIFAFRAPPAAQAVMPPPPPPPSKKKPEFEKLFNTPLNSRMALSPDGKLIALSGDQLEVRTLGVDGKLSEPINTMPVTEFVLYLEVDNEEVRYSATVGKAWRWRYRETKTPEEMPNTTGKWRGTTVMGDLVRTDDRGLAIAEPTRGLQAWPVHDIEIVSVSPDRKRVAYIEGGRFTGTISVRDVTTGAIATSHEIKEPMALTWLDPSTLLYASSTMRDPKIYRVSVERSFGTPELIHTQPTGWFSDLAYSGGRIYVVSMTPSPRGRVVEIQDNATRREELDSVSLGIGWDAQDRMVTWNKANLRISSHRGTLESEPANTTRSGDTLIATLRDLGGRRAVALSLTTGKQIWAHPDNQTVAVRCAGDREPPCFAIRYLDEERDHIVTIDPATGALGATIFKGRKIEDLAVRPDGKQILVTNGARLLEVAADGSSAKPHHLLTPQGAGRLNLIRSIAYVKDGILVAGTIGRNAYQVARISGTKFQPLDDTRDKILMLVRPSSDGKRIVYIARNYEPELFRMHLP
jgi:serine/threonine protein kinase